jgi:hypothetical protein
VDVSIEAKKLVAIAQCQPIATGLVCLTKSPKVCAVPIVVPACLPCELKCIDRRYTPRKPAVSAAEPIAPSPIATPAAPTSPPASPPPAVP